jgi:hypothetical protein
MMMNPHEKAQGRGKTGGGMGMEGVMKRAHDIAARYGTTFDTLLIGGRSAASSGGADSRRR